MGDQIAWWVELAANIAAVVTAVAAVSIWTTVVYAKRARRQALEQYLRLEREIDEPSGRNGLRSMLHLMANLAMTEEQINAAAFASKVIVTWPGEDDKGRADRIWFQYDAKAEQKRKRDMASKEAWRERVKRAGNARS